MPLRTRLDREARAFRRRPRKTPGSAVPRGRRPRAPSACALVENLGLGIDQGDREALRPAPAVLAKIGAGVPVFFAAQHFGDHQPALAGHVDRPPHELHTRQPSDRPAQQNGAEIGIWRVIDRVAIDRNCHCAACRFQPRRISRPRFAAAIIDEKPQARTPSSISSQIRQRPPASRYTWRILSSARPEGQVGPGAPVAPARALLSSMAKITL
jgi:hypothetical protein